MKEYIYFFVLIAILLMTGCSKQDNNNPITPPIGEVTKDGTISETETWSETGKVYHITADCSIEAQVTWKKGIIVNVDSAAVIDIENNGALNIEENVTVNFGAGAHIEVGEHSQGSLIAKGSASAPIILKAGTNAQLWGLSSASHGGAIITGDSAHIIHISYSTITGATAGIYVKNGSPVITNCKITSCKGDGIYFDTTAGPSDSLSFDNNTISDCGGYPLTLPAGRLAKLSSDNVYTISQGGKNAIRVLGTIVGDTNAVWKKMTLPYMFTGMTVIGLFSEGITLVTIMPGIVCTFEENSCIKIGDPRFGVGILKAIGTPTDSILFINNSPGIHWGDSIGGLWIGPESPGNTTFDYCSIRNATTGISVNAGVSVTISHCQVTGCAVNGITFTGGSPVDSQSFLDNHCIENAGYGISITADKLANLSGSGSVARNGKGGIYVTGANIWQSGTWKKYDMPYIVDGVLDISSTDGVEINIDPGTKFNFLPGAYTSVGSSDPGALIANGTGDLPIEFTSFAQNEYWGAGDTVGKYGGGIRIENNADTKTELSNCTIQNATSGIYVNANVKIHDCTLKGCKYYGLIRDKNADPALISGNSYSGNGTDTLIVPDGTD